MATLVYNPMQMEAHSILRQGKNLLLLSPTGSGKTLAFLLPITERIHHQSDALQVVVIVPTRELAQQIEQVWRNLDKKVRIQSCYGGRSTMDEHRRYRHFCPQAIVATPGRLLDHLRKENFLPMGVRTVVVDEYDKCLELGFREELGEISKYFLQTPQVALTSATRLVPSLDTDANPKSASRLPFERVYHELNFLSNEAELHARLTTKLLHSPEKDKLSTLLRLLGSEVGQRAIVFLSHRESVKRVELALKQHGVSHVAYHGGLTQEARERALYLFRAEAVNVLISTDLAARGLDIPNLSLIVHYHLPMDEAAFKHRSGRTARWDQTGTSVLILAPDEQPPAYLGDCQTLTLPDVPLCFTQPQWTMLYIGRGKKDKLSKTDVLGFLCKKAQLKAQQIGRIDIAEHASYVAVKREVLRSLYRNIAGEKIKGMKTIIEEMKK